MKVLIIEDEKYGFDNLCRLLRQIDPEISIDGPVTNIVDINPFMLCQQNYDIIFADIKLEDGVCFEALSNVELITPIVFVTAYDEYALKAFQTGGICYLLKPIDKEELTNAIERSLQIKRGSQDIENLLQSYGIQRNNCFASRLLVKSFNGASILPTSSINHIVFEEGKVNAYTNEGANFTLSEKTLDAVFMRLNPKHFFKANRQYIIHIDSINKIHTSFRQTENVEMKYYKNVRINISKERVPAFHQWIEQE